MEEMRGQLDKDSKYAHSRQVRRSEAIIGRDSGLIRDMRSVRVSRYMRNIRPVVSTLVMVAFVLSMVFVLPILLSPHMPDKAIPEEPTEKTPMSMKTLNLAPHDPIVLAGDADFTGPNASTGVTRGSGTSSDPYVIEGWEISGWGSYGISIYGVNVHFVIQDCYVHDLSILGSRLAIAIQLCSNGTISNCTLSKVSTGIWLVSSSGIHLVNNTCSNNSIGIELAGCVNTTFRQNKLVGDGILIEGNTLDHFNMHSIDTSNTANGNPIFYFRNQTGITVPAGAGQVLMANCSDMRIADQNISVADVGIEIAFCTRTNVTSNICSSNYWSGISIYCSDNISLFNNTCSRNYGNGIQLGSSHNCSLTDNTCSWDTGNAVDLYDSTSNILFSNRCSNSHYGIQLLDSCSNNKIQMNMLENNTGYGIYLDWCSNNRVWNNSFVCNNGAGATYDPAHIQAFDSGTQDWWNSTNGRGNFWSDWTTPDTSPSDGIVDLPYNITGDAGVKDYYPLTSAPTSIPEFGMMPLVGMVLLVMVLLTRGAERRKEH